MSLLKKTTVMPPGWIVNNPAHATITAVLQHTHKQNCFNFLNVSSATHTGRRCYKHSPYTYIILPVCSNEWPWSYFCAHLKMLKSLMFYLLPKTLIIQEHHLATVLMPHPGTWEKNKLKHPTGHEWLKMWHRDYTD